MSPSHVAVLGQCHTDHWNAYYALTLGLRWSSRDGQKICLQRHAGPPSEYSQNFHHFMKVLNDVAFGKAARRGFRQLKVIPVLEQDRSARFHYHAAIDRPVHFPHSDFCDAITKAWAATRWGHLRTDIIPNADSGWTKYILKRSSKANWFDSIDWQNFHNP